LIGREHTVEGNSKLQATESLAELVGPGFAGLLIDLLSAPFAIVANGLTYLWSAFWLGRIRGIEEHAADTSVKRHFDTKVLVGDLAVGWRAIMSKAPLRASFLAQIVQTISSGFFYALYMLFALRVIRLTPLEIGLIISVGGVGGLVGAFIAGHLVRVLGFGPAMIASFAGGQAGLLLLLLAAVGGPMAIPLMVGQQLLGDGGSLAFMILSRSLLQTGVAEGEIARANGLLQAAQGILLPLSALIAGAIAEAWGIQAAVKIGVAIGFAGILPLISPRLLALRDVAQAAA
jgi:hypothetical protein